MTIHRCNRPDPVPNIDLTWACFECGAIYATRRQHWWSRTRKWVRTGEGWGR